MVINVLFFLPILLFSLLLSFFNPLAQNLNALFIIWTLGWVGYLGFGYRVLWKKRPCCWKHLLLMALLCRLVLALGTTPSLSTDIYRYIWEGRVIAAGLNPYSMPPNHPSLKHLQLDQDKNINFPDIPAIYPPVSLFFFAGLSQISTHPLFYKIAINLIDMALCILLVFFLRQKQLPPERVFIYALHPLVLLEIGHSGHGDPLGILFLFLSLFLLYQSKPFLWSLVLSIYSKFIAVVAIPLLKPKQIPHALLLLILCGIFFYSPFRGPLADRTEAIQTYSQYWKFNDSIFSIVLFVCKNPLVARWMVGLAFISIWIGTTWHVHRRKDYANILNPLFILIQAWICLSPTVHPWYLLWILPFCTFFNRPHWILLSYLIIFSYWALTTIDSNTQTWMEAKWPRMVEYIPFYLVWFWNWRKGYRLANSC